MNARQLPATAQISSGVLNDSYDWDPVGNLLGVTDLRSNPGQSRTRSFAYDSAHRLKNATYAAVGLGTYTYRYNGLDNITIAIRPDGEAREYRYDDNGSRRLTQIVNQANQQPLIAYQYDANGNATLRDASALGFVDSYAFHYDRANRLTEVRNPNNPNDVKARYDYDGHARRALINERGDVRSQLYSQSGQYLFEEGDLISDADFSPGGNTATKGATRYQYLGNMLIAKSSGNQTTYLHTDHLGSPIAESTAAPVQVTHLPLHEPYGAPSNNTYLDGPGYTGHVVDGLTGLSYMQARYYDPVAGRFLGIDPVGAKDGANFNRYWYGNNNPYVVVDPDGRYGQLVVRMAARHLVKDQLRSMASQSSTGAQTSRLIEAMIDGPAGLGQLGVMMAVESAAGLYQNEIGDSAEPDVGDAADGDGSRSDTAGSASEKLRDGAVPARGASGKKGELERPGGREGADEAFDAVNGTNERSPRPGVRVKDLADGGRIETHGATKSPDYPNGTPTVKVQDANGKRITNVRFPES